MPHDRLSARFLACGVFGVVRLESDRVSDRETLLHQKIVRDQGMCGDVSPDGERICILPPGHPQPHPWDAPAGPLAHQFARLRELSARMVNEAAGCNAGDAADAEDEFLAALSVIERHVQDMETALREASDWIAEEDEVLAPADADWRGRLLNRIDAALSVGEERSEA